MGFLFARAVHDDSTKACWFDLKEADALRKAIGKKELDGTG